LVVNHGAGRIAPRMFRRLTAVGISLAAKCQLLSGGGGAQFWGGAVRAVAAMEHDRADQRALGQALAETAKAHTCCGRPRARRSADDADAVADGRESRDACGDADGASWPCRSGWRGGTWPPSRQRLTGGRSSTLPSIPNFESYSQAFETADGSNSVTSRWRCGARNLRAVSLGADHRGGVNMPRRPQATTAPTSSATSQPATAP